MDRHGYYGKLDFTWSILIRISFLLGHHSGERLRPIAPKGGFGFDGVESPQGSS